MVKPLAGCLLFSIVLFSCSDSHEPASDVTTSESVSEQVSSDNLTGETPPVLSETPAPTVSDANDRIIRYKPAIGDEFQYRVSMTMNARSERLTSNQSTNYYYTKRAVSRKDGVTSFAFKYDSIDMIREMIPLVNIPEGGPQKVEFSTTDPTLRELPQFQQYVRITEEEVTLKVNERGEILDVTGVDGIVEALFGERLNQVPQHERPALYKSFAWEAYIMPLQQEFVSLPDSAVTVGSTWHKDYSTNLSMWFPADLRIQYTLSSVENNNATLSASLSMNDVQKQVQEGNQSAELLKSSVEGTGTTELNLKHGYTVRKLHSGVTTTGAKVKGMTANGSEETVENTLETTQEVQLLNVVHGK